MRTSQIIMTSRVDQLQTVPPCNIIMMQFLSACAN